MRYQTRRNINILPTEFSLRDFHTIWKQSNWSLTDKITPSIKTSSDWISHTGSDKTKQQPAWQPQQMPFTRWQHKELEYKTTKPKNISSQYHINSYLWHVYKNNVIHQCDRPGLVFSNMYDVIRIDKLYINSISMTS